MRIHRDGHIEANKLELVLSDESLRRAKQSYNYIAQGFISEIIKELQIEVEGITQVQEVRDIETDTTRLLIQ